MSSDFAASNSWPVIGHEWAVEQLARALQFGRMRHAYVITGPAQIGKTTLARAFAAALNCTGTHLPCGECRACTLIAKDAHPDVTIVESESGSLKIDQIRGLQQMLALRPYEARYRVAILRRFHEARPGAQDALLKTLEEPSPNTVLILTANAADSLLPTILSRCQPLHLRPLAHRNGARQPWSSTGTRRRTPPARWRKFPAGASGGRSARCTTRTNSNSVTPHSICWRRFCAATGASGSRSSTNCRSINRCCLVLLDTWLSYWRDTLLLASGSQAPVTNYDHLEEMTQIAQQFGSEAAQKALEATRRTMSYLDKNANARLALEVLVLDYP